MGATARGDLYSELRRSYDHETATALIEWVYEEHAHELAEKLRDKAEGIACDNDHDFESAAIANEWDAAADFIDPGAAQHEQD